MTAQSSRPRALLSALALLAAAPVAALDPIFVGSEIALPGTAQAVAYDGSGTFLSAWPCGTAICGARVDAMGGAVEDHTLVATVGVPSHVRIAFDGSQFLLVWAETRVRRDIYAARVTPGGRTLDPGGIVVSRDLVPLFEGLGRLDRNRPEVGFDGGDFVVYWVEEVLDDGTESVYSARVSAAGVLLDPEGVFLGYFIQGTFVDLAAEGSDLAVLVAANLYGTTWIRANGWTLTATGASFSQGDWSVSGASDLIVFQAWDVALEFWGGGVFGHLLGSPAQSLIPLSPTGSNPLAAWEGASHLVAWTEGGTTVGVRLPGSGTFAETREACVTLGLCYQVPVPEFAAPGSATALASNGRGVSLVTSTDAARLLVSDFALAVADGLGAATREVTALPAGALRNANLRDTLLHRLRSVRNLIAVGDHANAALELGALVAKTDGCAKALAPDADDWIRTCAAQRNPYATLTWMLDLVRQRAAVAP